MITKNNGLLWGLLGVVLLLNGIALLYMLSPAANDDAFVYYTYARNITEGRPFAYDVRNIPSEGFSSLLFLLLLTPFEFLGVVMPFASATINLVAIFLTVGVSAYLMKQCGVLNTPSALLFIALLWGLIIRDSNVIENINVGLETMLGPLMIVLGAWAIWGATTAQTKFSARWLNAFFVVLFLAYITRPESFFFIATIGIPLLWHKQIPIRRLIKTGLVFAVCFAIYHGLKYLIFGDILPTGFYRKVTEGDGLEYVMNWVSDYAVFLGVLFALFIGIVLTKRQQAFVFHQRWVWFFVGIIFITAFFFTRTNPLVGYYHRFLMTPIFLIYIMIVASVVYLFALLFNKRSIAYYGMMLFLVGVSVYQLPRINDLSQLNIYHKAVEIQDAQVYLHLGKVFNEAVDNPSELTLVFGDAGAVPYVFDGTFIDFNGLSEPFIARLFSMPNSPQKTTLFIDYVLSHQPDIVFLGWEHTREGVYRVPPSLHTPFLGDTPIAIFQAYYDYGIRYACSINDSNSPDRIIHWGIWTQSPHYEQLQTALLAYCRTNGMMFEDGIRILKEDAIVLFEPIQ